MNHPETCATCAHGVDEKVEPGYNLVNCRAPWAVWNSNNMVGLDTGLAIPQPFRCSVYVRASAEACGCDRGVRHKCEAHAGG